VSGILKITLGIFGNFLRLQKIILLFIKRFLESLKSFISFWQF